MFTAFSLGTTGSYNNSGNIAARALDGNIATFFDSPTNTAWVGIDLGPNIAQAICKIRYAPRSGYANRMPGGVFQGANLPDFSDAIALEHTENFRFIPCNDFRQVGHVLPRLRLGDDAEESLDPRPAGLSARHLHVAHSLTSFDRAGDPLFQEVGVRQKIRLHIRVDRRPQRQHKWLVHVGDFSRFLRVNPHPGEQIPQTPKPLIHAGPGSRRLCLRSARRRGRRLAADVRPFSTSRLHL